MNIKVSETKQNDNGRYIRTRATIDDTNYILCNIYAPNNAKERQNFYKLIHHDIANVKEKQNLIIGGDFNCATNPKLDRSNKEITKPDIGTDEILSIQNEYDLEDI